MTTSNSQVKLRNKMADTTKRSIPQAQIVCDVDSARVVFSLRLGFGTSTENLKEECMATLKQRCRDDGMTFVAASADPQDYDLCPCRPDGTLLPHYPPLAGERDGAPPVRLQMPQLPSPLYLSFRAGMAWQQRQGLLKSEERMRTTLEQLWIEGLMRLRFVSDIHEERQLDRQILRTNQEALAYPMEALMVELYVAYHQYTSQVAAEQKALVSLYERFNATSVPAAEGLLKEYLTEMNTFYRSSVIKVETTVKVGGRVGGDR